MSVQGSRNAQVDIERTGNGIKNFCSQNIDTPLGKFYCCCGNAALNLARESRLNLRLVVISPLHCPNDSWIAHARSMQNMPKSECLKKGGA